MKLCYHHNLVMDKSSLTRLKQPGILFTAFHELGLKQLAFYSLYQFELRSGLLRWWTRGSKTASQFSRSSSLARLFAPLDRNTMEECLGVEDQEHLLGEAEEILKGRVRLFGSVPVQLLLKPPSPLVHWTEYERNMSRLFEGDIKFIWEPARFGWTYTLARAYVLTGDERYPAAFWEYLEEFLAANPPYLGLNWVSAQEAALRLIAWVFCWQVFAGSDPSTPERNARIAQAIVEHANRIPPSLAYARAQNNNHLLSEAAGLYTAGLALPDFPAAARWKKLGWRLFHQALQAQIDSDGTYCQHSMNYHRLMLQHALWVRFLANQSGLDFPARSEERLAAATDWLINLIDPKSGSAPNLGPNDGAYIMPLSALPQKDYRPVAQAAGQFFLGKRVFATGCWDEMGVWLGADTVLPSSVIELIPKIPLTLLSPSGDSWAYLRAAHFRGRPGHADQLHVDLWWRGINIARDAGTYLYNAPEPWENALAGSDVHNTVTVDGQEQMKRAGHFLYLSWAQAEAALVSLGIGKKMLVAGHNGYRRLGVTHQRRLFMEGKNRWTVEDELLAIKERGNGRRHVVTLHWLLPDWPWKLQKKTNFFKVRLISSEGPIELDLEARINSHDMPQTPSLQIIRAGELVYGKGLVKPNLGWFSPTYGQKDAALSVRLNLEGELPIYFRSTWRLG